MADEAPVDLTTLDGLLAILNLQRDHIANNHPLPVAPDGTYCPQCGAVRRMGITVLRHSFPSNIVRPEWIDPHLPLLLRLSCTQCYSSILVLVYHGPRGPEVAALPSTYGGLSTPNTPEAVAYHLDQAQRSQSIGALSAAIAMYRAALERLLFEQGYRKGMLNAKIEALEANPDPSKWQRDLDPEYLTVIKDLGNASIHPNDGDITKQQMLDAALVRAVQECSSSCLTTSTSSPERSHLGSPLCAQPRKRSRRSSPHRRTRGTRA
jgi:hypothetical protein